ncbi:GNAT family N-acetyltransferase [Ruania alba]|uniref:Predicted acetyltransferase n=1 Tax=Ruania alba TaxID=648782 RepID=A0A1H5GD32_9MICO|nr:GNAT family N-acetyltransferase [Ruania alba]SEE13623.1 Predicted acetyltransferase [Ruania alba]
MSAPHPQPTVRRYTREDQIAGRRLGAEAFGMPAGGPPPVTDEPWPVPGVQHWGAFDGATLAGQMVVDDFESWWTGSLVPTAGIAGVTVAAEYRGHGLVEGLFRAALGASREQGAVISTLFPSAPGIYRSFGYELVGSFDTVRVPTAAAAMVRGGDRLRVRRAAVADVPAVRAVYDAWAASQCGPLSRRGAPFTATDEQYLDRFTGVTVVENPSGAVIGYASWRRGPQEDSALEVTDLLALTADGYRALWRILGSHASIIPSLHLKTSGADPARLFLPTTDWSVIGRQDYMLRVDDVPGAFAARRLRGTAEATFTVAGDRLGVGDGTYRLTVADGASRCERVTSAAPDGVPTFTPQGLALLWAGVQNCATLRLLGHLDGGDPETDAALDQVLAGPEVQIRNHF